MFGTYLHCTHTHTHLQTSHIWVHIIIRVMGILCGKPSHTMRLSEISRKIEINTVFFCVGKLYFHVFVTKHFFCVITKCVVISHIYVHGTPANYTHTHHIVQSIWIKFWNIMWKIKKIKSFMKNFCTKINLKLYEGAHRAGGMCVCIQNEKE